MNATPRRITLSRRRGWRMPPNTVKTCRPGRYGNPYRVGIEVADDATAVAYFEIGLGYMPAAALAAYLAPLHGKNLACWCRAGAPCHADVLLRLANPPTA